MSRPSETGLESHFAFGENWRDYAQQADHHKLGSARTALTRILGRERLDGLTFLDLGCGSGLHAVAAAQLGAHVTAVDIDPVSVSTTQQLADRFEVTKLVDASVASVFDLDVGPFDVVYSFGVLHHTGAMWDAVRKAASLVSNRSGSLLVIALYRKTRFCRLWTVEKRWYAHTSPRSQRVARWVYSKLLVGRQMLRGVSPRRYREGYSTSRGMLVDIDIHDWLGGYPYESASPREVREFMESLGFAEDHSVVLSEVSIPLQPLGSGLDEYRFIRRP